MKVGLELWLGARGGCARSSVSGHHSCYVTDSIQLPKPVVLNVALEKSV